MPGSIGATDSARVFKGTRMAGRMGGDTVTVDNLELVEIDNDKNLLYIKGAVPGGTNALVYIVADGEIKFVEPKVKKEEIAAEKSETEVKDEIKSETAKPEENKESVEAESSKTPAKTEEAKTEESKQEESK